MSENELNDTFIYLIRVAEEDNNVRETLLKILVLDNTKRKLAIQSLVSDLKAQEAPEDFIEAMAYLSDDAIADTALVKLQNIKS